MANRKQRRRRDKSFRHEYGFVTYDEEGNEVEVEASDVREKKPEKQKAGTAQKGGRKGGRRELREPPAPSWRRAFRRGALWGGVMLLVVVFFFQGMPIASRVFLGILYAAAFIPLTYWTDSMVYRRFQRKQSAGQPPRSGKTR
jgi:hypothetical protein